MGNVGRCNASGVLPFGSGNGTWFDPDDQYASEGFNRGVYYMCACVFALHWLFFSGVLQKGFCVSYDQTLTNPTPGKTYFAFVVQMWSLGWILVFSFFLAYDRWNEFAGLDISYGDFEFHLGKEAVNMFMTFYGLLALWYGVLSLPILGTLTFYPERIIKFMNIREKTEETEKKEEV